VSPRALDEGGTRGILTDFALDALLLGDGVEADHGRVTDVLQHAVHDLGRALAAKVSKSEEQSAD
jgi:hypothetical protein